MGILDRLAGKPMSDEDFAALLCGKLPAARAADVERLSRELGVQRMDLFRAALELALPVFREHPEYFAYLVEKAGDEW
ncbi:hypothetical protein [Desulfonatronum parangueonense]